MTTKKLTTMAIFIALSIALVWLIHFPLFPAAPYLEYDPADIPILVIAFAFGPLAGIIVTAIAAVIQGLTVSAASGPYGVIMHFIATATLVLVAGNIYRIKRTRGSAIVALICGTVCMAAVMVPANLIVTPLFLGTPVEAVTPLILPIIVPFNLLKAGINSVIVFLLYKTISKFIKSEKKSGKSMSGDELKA